MQGSEKINEILLNLGIKAPTFAKRIGVKYQRILDIQSGKVKKISGELANYIINTYPQFDINWLLTGEGSMLKNTDQPVSQGGEDATLSEADLNNSNTMKKYLDQVLRQNEELIRQNGVLLDLFREERAKNKGEVALKKEG
ncbi:hypothetical protein [Phocaeicola plebeius]|jgi:hypothetical protein|uniref:hypothetical protein n=1 Tax=Phocaeicola plebeius TaxID=310297 RepID=UPI0020651F33|nr:hypothetical protein [Phocaeicola plebeius]DAI72922.1 MAG TPA: LAMBDA REPRESSOR (TRIPLE MUTANT)/DNA COMPLEX-DNA COMPLEX, DOUBLE HELIX, TRANSCRIPTION-DNA.1A [Caudoviricetes sp.]